MSGKSKYQVPTMKEIEELPWNGYNVVSTFSGGGGSCLGYRMAGYHVVWANEFVEEAQKTYRLNHPNTFLNTMDIRDVTAEMILKESGLKKGEVDLFDGSPPCCAFSTAGKREDGWGRERVYSDGKVQQVENLFNEYIRILGDLQPKTFVAENVSGLVKGSAVGWFREFIRDMRECGYNVEARLLKAQWLGVPQARERLIFVGVRKDLDMNPVYPTPYPYYYTLGDALETVKNDPKEVQTRLDEMANYKSGNVLRKIRKNPKKPITGASVMNGSYFNLRRESMYTPCGTICQMNGQKGTAGNCHPLEDRKFTIAELKRITSIPDDFVCTGTLAQQWERLGRMVPPVMMMNVAKTIQTEILDKAKG